MVISGTHALDIVMWCMEAKTPVECYARSIDKVLGPAYQGIDATAGMIMFSDGSVYHLNISWALPVTWPGAVYSLEAAARRLQSGHEQARRLHGQLSARRHGAWRIARPDARRDRFLAQPHGAWRADAGLHRGGSAPQPDADQGARSLGTAQRAGEAAARAGRRTRRRLRHRAA